ncbi:aldehyde dehydrogenase [Variovorax sp. NFACC27]|uniref:aldehyde dehydrogenase n=1 Tax=unclassified Variovorax TaxID=663243 RepID=UPI00089869B0|nr:betaine-aldehyde dehydrogenase [Variovorax paradoxus]SEF34162.1 Aldehyde dehydrogenase family protein [Variovorax sp. NFACC28]SEG80985.1 Aldehyde dehydrogenase family protein [Variovorax sp. NFACC29]SFD12679.1 Aldehyde dehydrogenase family protein [Variovorax sp. NFACC26]SFG15998.1 Aldehyde dehydrogenase family protein [Variovorax sp. NFACC27]
MISSELLPICIAGEWRLGGGDVYESLYPATGEPIARLRAASLADVEEAIAGADRAFRTSGWAQRLPHERAAVLHRVAQLIREESESLAQKQRLDNGKPINETRNLVASAAGTFQFFAAALETLEETITPSRGAFVTMSVHEPMGVVAAITPWNSPIASEAQKLAPALAAGNAVVVKPAEVTPLMALELARICEKAGVPKGIVSVLPGRGSVIGDAITKHPLVKRVSFTGGTTTGKHIAHIAADKMMPVSLELGGKSPTMVLDDADLDHAVNGVLYGIFSSSGESCIAGSRLFVARGIYDEFITRLAEGANALRVGDPASERTQMGPLITAKHREGIERYVDLGVSEGGRIRTGGVRPHGDGYDRGYFYKPTILEGLTNSARISQEEIFGPVLVAMPFDSEEELIEQANDSVYALAAGVWSRDFKRAWKLGRAVQAGTVWVNTYKQFSVSTPFGGWRDSGLGREKGREGIFQYMEQKSMYWGTNEQPLPWAAP